MYRGVAVDLGLDREELADTGYLSAANVAACAAARVEPMIAMGRERHHLSGGECFAEAPPAPEAPSPLDVMRHRLTTPQARRLHAWRKQLPKSVFGIIKQAMGVRQCSLRGLEAGRGAWRLLTTA